ncbi:MAG: hypothetical protein ACO3FE_10800 [Planctomycetaceae bacterium]|jgi:hypothetical protein
MLELRSVLSDDQIAVIGCLFALVCCLAMTGFSFRLGKSEQTESAAVRLRKLSENEDTAGRRAA